MTCYLGAAALALSLMSSGCLQAQVHDRLAPVPDEFFGLTFHRAARLAVWPPVAFGSLRLWDSYLRWDNLEPSPGDVRWGDFDRQVALGESAGAEVYYTLGQTPSWASSRPDERHAYGLGTGGMPRDLVDFERYIERVSSRYKGRISAYDVWNEPKFRDASGRCGGVVFFCGSAHDLVVLTRSAVSVIKRVDPAAKVFSPGFTGGAEGVTKLDQYLAAGGARLIDGVSFHFYHSLPEQAWTTATSIRNVLAKHKLAHLPIWNTEVGYLIQNVVGDVTPEHPAGPFARVLLPAQGAAFLARTMLVAASAGMDRVHWYAWDNRRMGAIDADSGTTSEVGHAFAVVRRWLRGASISCRESTPVITCQLERAGHTARVVWRVDGRSHPGLDVQNWIETVDGQRRLVAAGESPDATGRPYLIGHLF